MRGIEWGEEDRAAEEETRKKKQQQQQIGTQSRTNSVYRVNVYIKYDV